MPTRTRTAMPNCASAETTVPAQEARQPHQRNRQIREIPKAARVSGQRHRRCDN